MFEIGGTVLYGIEGVCTIKDIAEKSFGDVSRRYYVLEPMYQKKSTVFVPTDNEVLASKMRNLVSQKEIDGIINGATQDPPSWIEDDKERKEYFKEIIMRGESHELLAMSQTLHARQEELIDLGKKLGAADQRNLATVEKMIDDEFAAVLNIEPEEVQPFIRQRVSAKRRYR